MAQGVKVPDGKIDDLNLPPRTKLTEGKEGPPVSCPWICTHSSQHVCTHTCTHYREKCYLR